MRLYDLRTEYRVNPIGLTTKAPRFSWKLESDEKNTLQKSYHILVKDNENTVWDSGIKEEETSVLISYEGEKLVSETLYTVLVSVTDNHGNTSEITGSFETGALSPTAFS